LRTPCEQVATVEIRRSRWHDGRALGRSLLTGEPLLIARDRVATMEARVRALAGDGRYDAVHADQLWMAPYALAARASGQRARPPHLVLDQHNAVYLVPERLALAARNPLVRLGYRRESALMRQYEARTCLAFDQVVTVTDEDRAKLMELYRNGRRPHLTQVIPICVDPETTRARARQPDTGTLLFVGGLHWPPNADGVEWFVREVLPRVRARRPQACLTVIGKGPSADLLGREADGVHCLGYVDDLDAHWERCDMFIVPLRAGGGMRVKILDAWSRGVPVISTRIGAEGLAGIHGHNLLLADTAEAFADSVIQLMTDPALAQRIGAEGRRTVEARYNWRRVYRTWHEVYADVP
jgi:polysaccharide biosynthesis protein PslH